MMYLSRLQLRKDPSLRALKGILDPSERGRALDSHHRLIWTLFSDKSTRKRDFLWRYMNNGQFLVLSQRPPTESSLFEKPEVKEFAPHLAAGDRLQFTLRANATRSVNKSRSERGQRVDVVMHMLHSVSGKSCNTQGDKISRADARMELAQKAATTWLDKQGVLHGFSLETTVADDYSVISLPFGAGLRKRKGAHFGVLDISGILGINKPDAFISAVATGFGRAKAFGCGLMLIRRI